MHDPIAIRPELGAFGLTPQNYAGDLGALAWLSFLNPFMEECFWRLFVFESLRHAETTSATTARWWVPALATNALYAAYHVPVVMVFLPAPLVACVYAFLVAFGLQLQLIVRHVGLVLAVSVHFAGDMAVSIIVTDLLWRWGLEGPA